MKSIFIIFLSILSFSSFSQNTQGLFDKAYTKQKNNDYKGAIKDYEKVIKADPTIKQAYYNRGTCYLGIKDFKSAILDFNKTIEMDPTYKEAYYNRAVANVSQEKFKEAIPDLDKILELDPKFPNTLTLRGQLKAQTGDLEGGCNDFNQAKENGDKEAKKYISQFCNDLKESNDVKESLMLDWPDAEKWKVGSNQQKDKMIVVELIHENETLENWTEFGYMNSVIGLKNIDLEKAMNITFEQAKKTASKSKLTFIEKDLDAEYPWIIFKIESPSFANDKTPESQVWYIIQGKTALYSNFRAIKKATIPEETTKKWLNFFKTGKVVNR